MPLVVLACAVFAQATSEFMLAGLVPAVAADLAVPAAAAGSLTAVFAAGMVLGAPPAAALARRWPPRPALAGFLAVFVVVHVVGALTPSFAVLVATRLLAACANAGFLAVALSVAVAAAGPGRTARAAATLLAGTALALVAGVPAGALLGHELGWRATFWAVAAVAALALAGVLAAVPAAVGGGNGARAVPALRAEAAALRAGPVVRTLLLAALVNGATFAAHTYLASLLGAAGGPSAVPAGLLLFGLGAVAGVAVAGRHGDARLRTLLVAGGVALPAGWAGAALLVDHPVPLALLVGLLGAAGFALGSALVARALALAPGAPTLGGATATASLNLGATAGPLLGAAGLAVAGPAGPAWVAALLGAVALPVAAGSLTANPTAPPGRGSTAAPSHRGGAGRRRRRR
ncbi:MFS transporter [Pseudonocardia sp. DW16-2]|uniref:MFS transporter n=1 Tax=Pseudonocardia spirodelae TaxID=3133431 RepID=A0ABU8TDI8_9PSEU